MGYSVTIKVKNKEIGDKIIAFCQKNLKSWAALCNEATGQETFKLVQYCRGPLWARDEDNAEGFEGLGYCRRKLHIGFDYKPSLGEREYVMCLIRWLAFKFGDHVKNGNPRYLFDGCEWTEIVPKQHDCFGLPTDEYIKESKYTHIEIDSVKECCNVDFVKVVRLEISRLDELWEKISDH